MWRKHGLDCGLVAALVAAVAAGRGVAAPPPAADAGGRAPSTPAGGGAVLVFLPGVAEIHRVQRELERLSAGGLYVLQLHGSLTAGDQVSVDA